MPFPAIRKYYVTNNHNYENKTDSLQNPNHYFIIPRQRSPERASLSAFLRASVTIEAAFILPIFMLALSSYLFLLQVLQIQLQVEQGLYGVSKNMAVKAYAYKNPGLDIGDAGEFAITVPYVKNEVEAAIGELEFCGERSYLLSTVMGQEEVVDIVVTYEIAMPFGIFRLPNLQFVQRARTKAWTGYVKGSMDESNQEQYVYVTVNGTVYHLSLNCTHIQLSIEQIWDQVEGMRNEQGGKYHACERCVKGGAAASSVYVTKTGDRYHNSLSCSGLKRGIQMVNINDIEGMGACSRCGGSK